MAIKYFFVFCLIFSVSFIKIQEFPFQFYNVELTRFPSKIWLADTKFLDDLYESTGNFTLEKIPLNLIVLIHLDAQSNNVTFDQMLQVMRINVNLQNLRKKLSDPYPETAKAFYKKKKMFYNDFISFRLHFILKDTVCSIIPRTKAPAEVKTIKWNDKTFENLAYLIMLSSDPLSRMPINFVSSIVTVRDVHRLSSVFSFTFFLGSCLSR